ncbi:hypothetical protein NA57DRAFT_57586 [Rhizodiscina lignyota]|uniref:Uncharacterized protein n=1 Tax=Rhizodiscina lignyota TaxID=1504668 RepID=A0A9P4ICY2_9PEZI|nr:hypothetical protein NA57DRAFT_57586 [Rhizodiscina lignyota]
MSYHQPYRGLPRELRDMIYEAALCRPEGLAIIESQDLRYFPQGFRLFPGEPIATNILLANREMRAEALPILFGKNAFDFRLAGGLEFLRSLPSTSLACIESIILHSDDFSLYCDKKDAPNDATNALGVITKKTNIKHIMLGHPTGPESFGDWWSKFAELRSDATAALKYMLLSADPLQTVEFRWPFEAFDDAEGFDKAVDRGIEAIADITEEFALICPVLREASHIGPDCAWRSDHKYAELEDKTGSLAFDVNIVSNNEIPLVTFMLRKATPKDDKPTATLARKCKEVDEKTNLLLRTLEQMEWSMRRASSRLDRAEERGEKLEGIRDEMIEREDKVLGIYREFLAVDKERHDMMREKNKIQAGRNACFREKILTQVRPFQRKLKNGGTSLVNAREGKLKKLET